MNKLVKCLSSKYEVSTQIMEKPFFSSSLADVALKARSLHEHKQSERRLYKDMKCPF